LARPYGSDDLVRRIKDALDIVDVIGSYVELTPRGTNHMALCPFHAEKTPSFSVNRNGQFFHCFGCKKSGDVFDFITSMEGVSFVEALKLLGDRCGIQVDRSALAGGKKRAAEKTRIFQLLETATRRFEQNLQSARGVDARKYLNHRQILPDVASRFRIGFATAGWHDLKESLLHAGFSEAELLGAGLVKRSDKGGTYDLFRNRLMLPIFDMQGRIVGFGGRVLDDSLPKYINSPDSPVFHKSRLFYGIHLARRVLSKERCGVVVEGYTDVIMAHGRGVGNTIATLGTALTDEHAGMLRRMVDRVILFFDGDEAGRIAAGRGVEILLGHDLDVTVVALREKTDPFDFFSRHTAEDFRELVAGEGKDFFDFTLDYYGRRYDLGTPGGKSRLARELLRLVDCHRDLIKKELLLKKTAETVGISEEVVRREYAGMKEGRTGKPRNRPDLDAGLQKSITITSSEDDLILGLVKEPALVGEYLPALESLETEDEDGAAILKAVVDLHKAGSMSVRELTTALGGRPPAMRRVIALAADPRKTDPRLLVSSALESLAERRRRKEFETIRQQRKELLRQAGSAEADRLLEELNKKLKYHEGARKRTDGS
jgi:DNA primase